MIIEGCIIVFYSSINGFWLPCWYLQAVHIRFMF